VSEIFPFFWAALVLTIFLCSLKMIWRAFRSGEIPDSVLGGAANSENHYGFVLRLLFLVLIAGGSLFLLTRVPAIFSLVA
jgi:hypothetical protein